MPPIPDVSVVIPTRNRPALVLRAVRSALAQTHRGLEVVVVVDGPDDATAAALRDLGDPRVRTVPLPERGGAPNARNQGVLAARGAWVALLDDDDEWLPGKIEAQLRMAATSAAPAPIVATRLINRTPRAESLLPRRLPEPNEPISEYLTVRRGLFYGDGFIQTSTIMAPAALLRRVPFRPGVRRAQELDWTLRAVRQEDAELMFVPDPLVLWHQDEDRDRITLSNPWAEMLAWLRSSRDLFTPRAYAAFAMSVLGSTAATTRSYRVFREVLGEARRHGRPGVLDYLTYAQVWALPPAVRAKLRDRVLGRRETPATPAPAPVAERVDA